MTTTIEPSKSPSTISAESKIASRKITIKLVHKAKQTDCAFWLGLAKEGTCDGRDFFEIHDLSQLFTKAYKEGIKESEPILMAHQIKSDLQFSYIVPSFQDEGFRPKVLWMEKLTSSIKSLNPKNIGFYLVPELPVAEEGQHELLVALARNIILSTDINEVFFYCEPKARNYILDTVLHIKEDLTSTDKPLDIELLH